MTERRQWGEADVGLRVLLHLAVGVCCELFLLSFVAGSMLVYSSVSMVCVETRVCVMRLVL